MNLPNKDKSYVEGNDKNWFKNREEVNYDDKDDDSSRENGSGNTCGSNSSNSDSSDSSGTILYVEDIVRNLLFVW